MENQKTGDTGTGIFRKVLNMSGISRDNFYVIEELSWEDKKYLDNRNAEMMAVEWDADETTCIQELYSDLYCNPVFEFFHRGFLYSFDSEFKKDKSQLWSVYYRDLKDPKYCYNSIWENEPHSDYPDLPSLVFGFKLKNDGRTIAEYCCDYWKQPRILLPEPVDMNLVRKVWRH